MTSSSLNLLKALCPKPFDLPPYRGLTVAFPCVSSQLSWIFGAPALEVCCPS